MVKHVRLLLILFLSFAGIFKCMAGIETMENFSTLGIDIRTITGASPLIIQDDKINNPNFPNFDWSIVQTNSIKNTVSVRLVNQKLLTYAIHFRVILNIQYYTDHALTQIVAVPETLYVDYDPNTGKSYKAIDTYTYTGAYQTSVSVTSVTNMDSPGDTGFPAVIQLGGSMVIDRTYNIASTINLNVQATKLYGTTSNTSPAKQLKLSWDFTPGQEEYDVEWTAIDDNSDYATLISDMLAAEAPPV